MFQDSSWCRMWNVPWISINKETELYTTNTQAFLFIFVTFNVMNFLSRSNSQFEILEV